MTPIRILIADDHAILRAGLRVLLGQQSDLAVIGEAGDGQSAMALVENEPADVIVMDLGMPGVNGIEATREIASRWPRIAILVLSMHSDEAYVVRALKAGAKGYLLKESAETELIDAVRAMAAGQTYFSRKIIPIATKNVDDPYEKLTAREREILQLIGEGFANKEIAQQLNLSVFTVETHRSNILEKLDIHSSAGLILYAVRRGIV